METPTLSRSEGFPARDIWFLGVILPGQDQMERVLGKPPPPSPSLGNSCRHSGQETMIAAFPKVLGSGWEIFDNGDRGSAQNFAADLVSIVVWLGEPLLEKLPSFKKCILFQNRYVQKNWRW